jgi:hypothetical protein
MADNPHKSLQAGPEQILYAKVLEWGMYVGLLLLIITYVIYLTGIVKPYLPHADVPKYWSMPVSQYLHDAHIPHGWGWITMVSSSDFLNFIPVAILAGVTIICFLCTAPVLFRRNDKVYAVLALVEAAILCVAASGILGSGGH